MARECNPKSWTSRPACHITNSRDTTRGIKMKKTWKNHTAKYNTRIYSIWGNMLQRCSNPNNTHYKWYGGKGVSVCEEWKDSGTFIAWANANGYEDNLTLDRIDGSLGYAPINCRWVTRKIQSSNMRMSSRNTINPSWRTNDMSKVNHGKRFESDFIASVPDRCDVTRLKDAGGWSNATNTRFTISNPCDFIIFTLAKNYGIGRMYKIELKSLLGKSLPYANIKPKTEKLTAKENSLKFIAGLCKSGEKGVRALLVVNFRDVNETYAMKASDVHYYIKNADRASIPISCFREHGQLINQALKRTRYRYDLEWL